MMNVTQAYNALCDKLDALKCERDAAIQRAEAAERQIDEVGKNAVELMAGRCKREDRHGNLTFGEWVSRGGGACSMCLKMEKEAAEREAERWRGFAEELMLYAPCDCDC